MNIYFFYLFLIEHKWNVMKWNGKKNKKKRNDNSTTMNNKEKLIKN